MPKEDWETQQSYAKDIKPMGNHARNDFYYGLLQEFTRHHRLPTAGHCPPGIMIPLAGLQGVTPETALSVEVAGVERDWLMSDGHLHGSDGLYLEDVCSDALVVSYLLESSLCCAQKPSSAVSFQTRSIPVMNALLRRYWGNIMVDAEDYLFEDMDSQVLSGKLRSMRFNSERKIFVQDTVSVSREAVVPSFLLQAFTRFFLKGLQKKSARIKYAEAWQGVHSFIVSLEESYMRRKAGMGSELLSEMAWDGKSPAVILPVFDPMEPGSFDLKRFNMLAVRDIQWL